MRYSTARTMMVIPTATAMTVPAISPAVREAVSSSLVAMLSVSLGIFEVAAEVGAIAVFVVVVPGVEPEPGKAHGYITTNQLKWNL